MEWLDESEKNLDSEVEIANEPDKIKMQLLQHKVCHLISVYWKITATLIVILIRQYPVATQCFWSTLTRCFISFLSSLKS